MNILNRFYLRLNQRERCLDPPPNQKNVHGTCTLYILYQSDLQIYLGESWNKTDRIYYIFYFCLGVLGSGQKVGSEETFPVCELVDLLQQVHEGPGRLLREELPGVCLSQDEGKIYLYFELDNLSTL